MLKPLRTALTAWTPGRGHGARDPLGAIAAAWPQLVGPELARATRPTSIAGETLVVVTASSAWSQQLSFLAPEIVRALGTIPAAAGIERMRFRVGLIERARRRGAEQPSRLRAVPGAPLRGLLAPAASLDEALERIRNRFAENRDAKRAHGWKSCARPRMAFASPKRT